MFGSWTYLIWLAVFMGVPLLVLLRWRTHFRARWRAIALAVLGSLAGGWAWDALSVRLGIWYYARENISGFWIIGLPVEEWLWIMGITLLFGLTAIVLIDHEGVRA
jgi:lycopene cyclase domain-containing protein